MSAKEEKNKHAAVIDGRRSVGVSSPDSFISDAFSERLASFLSCRPSDPDSFFHFLV